MTLQTFRELMSRRPFRLVTSGGQAYEVRHPEMAMLTRTDILVGVDAEDDAGLSETLNMHAFDALPRRPGDRLLQCRECAAGCPRRRGDQNWGSGRALRTRPNI